MFFKYNNMNNNHNSRRNHHTNENNKNNDRYNLRYKQGNPNGNCYDLNVSKQLLNYIYSSVELSKYKYTILKTESDLHMLDVKKYKVSSNFNGINYLLLFVKIKDKKYSCLIDRRKLSYNLCQTDYNSLRIMNVRVALDESIYNGTIIDGTYVAAKKMFVISDCYRFRGKDMTNDQLPIKLININSYLDANYKSENIVNTINLCVNKIYDLSETEKLITSEIPKAKNVQIRGLVFHPIVSSTKLIFLFNNSCNTGNTVDNNNYSYIHNTKTNTTNKKNITYACKTDKDIIMTLQIKNTSIIDVYKLYAVELVNKQEPKINNKSVYKIKKLGMAYIPTKECSHMCRSLFIDNNMESNKKRILVKCKFDKNKNKWIPLEQDTKLQRPSSIDEIETYMDIIEDTDSDSD